MEETIGSRIQRLRLANDLSVSALARKVGVSPSTLRDWEYGRSIKGEPYLALAANLGVSVHYLLSGQSLDSSITGKAVKLIEEALTMLKNGEWSPK